MAVRGEAYFTFARAARRQRGSRFYSPFVRGAKVVLPAAAAVLLLAVFAWPEADEILVPGWDDQVSTQVSMTNMEAYGWDEDRPYSIRSAGVRRLGEEGRRFLMDRPRAWMVLPDGAWLSGSSESGVVDWTERTVHLSGEVRLSHEAGYAIHTQAAFVNLADRTAAGDGPVEGGGNAGRFRAEGFQVLDGGNRILLLGRSAVRFDSAPAAAPQ